MGIFVVDSNFFIEAHRKSYPLDIVPSFWMKVKQLAEDNKIISIDKVKNELFKHEDALKQWCDANLPVDFFKDTTLVLPQYANVAAWAISRNTHYMPNALAEFLHADEADAFLIAFALAEPVNRTLVTQEISEPQRKSKVKIPEACDALDVSYCNTIEMLRRLGERI